MAKKKRSANSNQKRRRGDEAGSSHQEGKNTTLAHRQADTGSGRDQDDRGSSIGLEPHEAPTTLDIGLKTPPAATSEQDQLRTSQLYTTPPVYDGIESQPLRRMISVAFSNTPIDDGGNESNSSTATPRRTRRREKSRALSDQERDRGKDPSRDDRRSVISQKSISGQGAEPVPPFYDPMQPHGFLPGYYPPSFHQPLAQHFPASYPIPTQVSYAALDPQPAATGLGAEQLQEPSRPRAEAFSEGSLKRRPKATKPSTEGGKKHRSPRTISHRGVSLTFSIPVRRTYATLYSMFSTSLQQSWPERAAHTEHGAIRVHRATSSKQFITREGQHSIELSCHKGPLQGHDHDPFKIQWLHMQREHMDLADFEDMSLNAPKISGELKYVVLNLFKKIRNACQKKLFDGLQIEPGTVLRFDGAESSSIQGHGLSATFICFPYMSLKNRRIKSEDIDQPYPTRSMLQVLYPYESTSGRESSPTFCKHLPKASKMVMYVPQLWAVVLGSKYIVTCAEAGAEAIQGSSITFTEQGNVVEQFPSVVGDWDLGILTKAPRRNKFKSLLSNTDRSPKQELSDSLSEEIANHAIDQAVDERILPVQPRVSGDDSHSGPNRRPETSSPPIHLASTILDTTFQLTGESVRSSYSQQTSEDGSGTEAHAGADVTAPNDTRSSPSLASAPVDPFQFMYSDSDDETEPWSAADDIVLDDKQAYLSTLMSLGKPIMKAEYLSAFIKSIKALLEWRGELASEQNTGRAKVIKRLEESVQRAEILRSMCELELDRKERVFSGHGGYREALMKTIGIQNPTSEQELQRLHLAIRDAIRLFDDASWTERQRNTTVGSTEPKIMFETEELVSSPSPMSIASTSEQIEDEERPTPPFLTWASLSSAFDRQVPSKQLAAENLFTIMEDINRNMDRHKEISYAWAGEVELQALEASVASSTFEERVTNDYRATDHTQAGPSESSSPQRERHPSFPHRLPARTSRNSHVAKDIILTPQRQAITGAIHELFKITREFVGLFIPESYNHRVAKKIWGALHAITNGAHSGSSGWDETGRFACLIRPLEKSVLEDNNIEKPALPIEGCSSCRTGTIYRSVEAAIAHLKSQHFRYSSSLQQLSHLRGAYSHWVRTEEQLRSEYQYEQQLRLLTICLTYLKILGARAKKIHAGVSLDNNSEYQLPKDLIDCFEATAIFIMQAATSLAAVNDEIRQWQYEPGFETPSVVRALDRLGELGKTAQASMTRAEKTLALSDPETNMVSMGPAGPELLVSIICQNLRKKRLIEDVEMDINELYQSCASRLQYQINHSPRKRLLRDIHALQEEVSVAKLVNKCQQKTYACYLKVLDPRSFEIGPANRATMFASEFDCLKNGLKDLHAKAAELKALESRTAQLTEQLKQSVEILEEDHGKAILVFTMITTVFLPLSFVTSFFGMNTADIRSTNYNQGFFWAIALPVTFGIVGVAVLFAYQGDKLSDVVFNALSQLKQESPGSTDVHSPLALTVTRTSSRAISEQSGRLWRRTWSQLKRSKVESVLRT